MHKTQTANMQRGLRRLALNDAGGCEQEENQPKRKLSPQEREQSRRLISNMELDHFGSDVRKRDVFLDSLEPFVRNLAQNGFKHPKDVSRLLNKSTIKTACGDTWNPRLAFFLLGFLFDPARAGRGATGTRPHSRTAQLTSASKVPATPASLTREEIARRLQAIGRVRDAQP
jgi:hypothetical protein